MHLPGQIFSKQSEGAGETGEIRNGILVKAGKTAVKQAGPQFPFQSPERPVLEMLEDQAAQEPVWSDGRASEIKGALAAFGQGLFGQIQKLGILEDGVEGIEQIIGDGGGLFREGEIEQRGLAR